MNIETQSVRFSGYHSHVCDNCGTKWVHPDRAQGLIDLKEHTCPSCGKLLPVIAQPPGTYVEGMPETASKGWRKGFAKETVIMSNGQERQIVKPQNTDYSAFKIGAIVFVIAIGAALIVYAAMPQIQEWLEGEK